VPGYLTSFWVFWERFWDKEFRSFGFNEEREKARPRWRSQCEGSDFFSCLALSCIWRRLCSYQRQGGASSTCSVAVANFLSLYTPSHQGWINLIEILCNAVQERSFLDIGISSVLIHKVHLSCRQTHERVNGPCRRWLGQCTSTGSNRPVCPPY
jgi:hypothetical protein